MHFDALCLACIASELTPLLLPGRVQQVLLASPRALGFEIYAHGTRQWLLVSAAPDDARIHLLSAKVRRGVERETPLLLLLRKYVRDGFLVGLRHSDPSERIMTLEFSHKQHGKTALHVELLGRAANLIFAREGGAILDSLVRIPPDDHVLRVVQPGRPYAPPPLGDRLSPLLPVATLAAELEQVVAAPGPLWKALSAHVGGMGPSQAREVVRRARAACGVAHENALRTAEGSGALAAAIAALWAPVSSGAWEPGLWQAEGRVIGFSPWRPLPTETAPDFLPTETLSEAIERTRMAVAAPEPTAAPLPADAYAAQRQSVAQSLRAARARLMRALDALAADEPPAGAAALLRTQAEWLLALHTTLPPDATRFRLSAQETGGPAIDVALDPTQTPVQQAEAMFRRAAKLKRTADFIPIRRARLLNDLAFLSDLEAELAQAQNQPEIASTQRSLVDSGLAARQPRRRAQGERVRQSAVGQPRRFHLEDGSLILVGRNARQNDQLTFTTANSSDLWFHLRGAAGAHVLLVSHGREASAEAMEAAARLAGYYSTSRDERAVDVIMAERRHVSRVPGGHPGQVIVRQERVLRVAATLPDGLVEAHPGSGA